MTTLDLNRSDIGRLTNEDVIWIYTAIYIISNKKYEFKKSGMSRFCVVSYIIVLRCLDHTKLV